MTIVYAKHEPWDHKIGGIVADMRRLGPPTLRAVYYGGFHALEGSHRLAAAHYLWLTPTLIIEPLDAPDDGLAAFWLKARDRLPWYDFQGLVVRWPIEDMGGRWYGSAGR